VNVDLGIWSKLTKIVVALVVIAVLLLIGVCYLPLIQTNERYRQHIMALEKQLQEETLKSQELQAQIDAISHDPKTVERLAREKLGYARPDETVVRFETNAPNTVAR
jgi:cell division protein FtsB